MRIKIFRRNIAGRAETRLSLSGTPSLMRVLDASGRRVATLPITPSLTEVTWKGTDDRGRRVPAGVYFIEVVAGSDRVTRRVLVLP